MRARVSPMCTPSLLPRMVASLRMMKVGTRMPLAAAFFLRSLHPVSVIVTASGWPGALFMALRSS